MKTLGVLLGSVALASCSSLRVELGEPLDVRPLADLRTGESRVGDALELFGAPFSISPHAGGFALIYEHLAIDEWQLGFSGKAIHLDLIKFVYGKTDADHTALVLVFDEEGVLEGAVTNSWPEDIGTSGGLQFLIQVDNVVSTDDLREPRIAEEWGQRCLLPLATGLNLAHRPDLVHRGVHLRAGQLTLEQRPWRK